MQNYNLHTNLAEATKFLQFVAQATHELLPPDVCVLFLFGST